MIFIIPRIWGTGPGPGPMHCMASGSCPEWQTRTPGVNLHIESSIVWYCRTGSQTLFVEMSAIFIPRPSCLVSHDMLLSTLADHLIYPVAARSTRHVILRVRPCYRDNRRMFITCRYLSSVLHLHSFRTASPLLLPEIRTVYRRTMD